MEVGLGRWGWALGPGLFELGAEPLDVAFDFALETEAFEAEATHGPVGLFGPIHKWVVDRNRWVNAVVVELDVGVDARAREASAVEFAWTERNNHCVRIEN